MLLKDVKLSKDHWSCKLLRFTFPGLKTFNNFCPHFWFTILSLGILPGTLLVKSLIILARKIEGIGNYLDRKSADRSYNILKNGFELDLNNIRERIVAYNYYRFDLYFSSGFFDYYINKFAKNKLTKVIYYAKHIHNLKIKQYTHEQEILLSFLYREYSLEKNKESNIVQEVHSCQNEYSEILNIQETQRINSRISKNSFFNKETNLMFNQDLLIKIGKWIVGPILLTLLLAATLIAIVMIYYILAYFIFVIWWYWDKIWLPSTLILTGIIGGGSIVWLIFYTARDRHIASNLFDKHNWLIRSTSYLFLKINYLFASIGKFFLFICKGILLFKSKNCPAIIWED